MPLVSLVKSASQSKQYGPVLPPAHSPFEKGVPVWLPPVHKAATGHWWMVGSTAEYEPLLLRQKPLATSNISSTTPGSVHRAPAGHCKQTRSRTVASRASYSPAMHTQSVMPSPPTAVVVASAAHAAQRWLPAALLCVPARAPTRARAHTVDSHGHSADGIGKVRLCFQSSSPRVSVYR